MLANPYFVPDQGVLRALRSAARRGVDVRLLVPLASDSRLLDFATRAVFPQLLAAAARIFRSPVVSHTKALMVDDTFFSIGSYNFDHRSLAYNLELVVNVIDPSTAIEVGTMLISDMAASEELTADRLRPPRLAGRLHRADGLRPPPLALKVRYFFLGGFFAAGGLAAGLGGLGGRLLGRLGGGRSGAARPGRPPCAARGRARCRRDRRREPISPPPANGQAAHQDPSAGRLDLGQLGLQVVDGQVGDRPGDWTRSARNQPPLGPSPPASFM